jgi:hypothetical protein
MANLSQLSKPPKKGEPPAATAAVDNLTKSAMGGNVPLQLKISAETRRDFKGYALAHDMDANELFDKVWSYYKGNHG